MIYKKRLKKLFFVFLLVVAAFVGKFIFELCYSPLAVAEKHPDSLTILYRPGCGRCKESLPRLIPRALFSTKRDYFINADHLTKEEQVEVGLDVTPGFLAHHEMVQTVNKTRIDEIWKETH